MVGNNRTGKIETHIWEKISEEEDRRKVSLEEEKGENGGSERKMKGIEER